MTQHPPTTTPANPLADDIRQINDWQDIPDDVRQYVTRLADRVEQLASGPPEPDPLDAEQEIRADALTAAARLAATGKLALSADFAELLDFADHVAAYIRDGSRP